MLARERLAASARRQAAQPSLAARYLENKTRRFFDFFCTPPPPSCSPGLPEADSTIDKKNKRPG